MRRSHTLSLARLLPLLGVAALMAGCWGKSNAPDPANGPGARGTNGPPRALPRNLTAAEARVQASDIDPVEVNLANGAPVRLEGSALAPGFVRFFVTCRVPAEARLTIVGAAGEAAGGALHPAAVIPARAAWGETGRTAAAAGDVAEFFAINDPSTPVTYEFSAR